jgi:hypothetical protein
MIRQQQEQIRANANAMTARRADTVQKQQGHVAMTAKIVTEQGSFPTMLAQKGGNADVSQNFAQTSQEISDMSTQTLPNRTRIAGS